jgi:hypothetical protein
MLLRTHIDATRTVMIIAKALIRSELHIAENLEAKADILVILNMERVEDMEE